MVKNKTGGNKSKTQGSKFSKKIVNIPEPDFENSFFAEVTTKPNGLIANVKLLSIPENKQDKLVYNFKDEYMKEPIQVNIGKLKGDKRNSYLAPGEIVQVEINFDMKRANGSTFAYVLCKYSGSEVRQFRKLGLILNDKMNDEDEETFLKVDSSDEKEDINIEDL
jgi:hypothetical protein